MKTVKYQIIDDIKIVTNISPAYGFVDPEATRIVVEKEFAKTETARRITELKNQRGLLHDQALAALRNAYHAKTPGEKTQYTAEYQDFLAQEKATEKPLSDLAKEKAAIWTDLVRQNSVYTGMPKNEDLISDSDADEFNALMIEATSENKLVTRDKQKVVDLRGKIYWRKNSGAWVKTEISKIGVDAPSGGKLFQELNETQQAEIAEQIEKDRIASLTVTARKAEKEAALSAAVTRAGAMKNELEVTGDPQALQKAQAWLADEQDMINLIYS